MQGFEDALYQNALDLSETVVFEYDIQNDVMSFTENVGKYMPCASVIASYVSDIAIRGKVHPEDIKEAISFFKKGKDDTKLRLAYLRFLDFAGEYPTYQLKGKLILNGDGKPVLLYGTMTLRSSDFAESGIATNRDPLTLLENRETSKAKISNYFKNVSGDTLADILLLDMDNFATYNAMKGEVAGDKVLLEVAKVLRKALRGADIIGRYGADQFVICMKGVEDERVLGERATFIIDSIRELTDDSGEGAAISASVGIGVGSSDEADFDVIFQRASEALAYAKAHGKRNFALKNDVLHDSEEYKNIRITSRELELVKSILDPILSWAYAVDENHNLIYVNQALSSRLHLEENEGVCYAKIKGYSSPCPDCPMFSMSSKSANCDCAVYSPSMRMMLDVRSTRITLRNKTKIYIIANVNSDIEKQMQVLDDSSERYTDAMMRLNDIIWDVNLTSNSCLRLRENKIINSIEDRNTNYTELIRSYANNVVHPDDLDAFFAVFEPERIRKARRMGMEEIRKEIRLLTDNMGYKWFSVTALLYADDGQTDETVFISARDVDRLRLETIEKFTIEEKYRSMRERSEFQTEIVLNNERYEHVSELSGIYVFEYDVPKDSYFVCSSFDTIFDVTPEMMVGEWGMLEGLVPYEKDRERYESFLHRIKTQLDTHTETLRFMTNRGNPIWFTITVQALRGMNNSVVRLTGILQNVNAEMEVKAELEFRADYDSLTGLFNTEHFNRLVREKIHREADRDFVILSVDIKRFKVINERYGIDAGNKCLRYLAGLIKDSIPRDGLASRYQADEFNVLIEYVDDRQIFDYMTGLNQAFCHDDATGCGSGLAFGVYKIHQRDLPVRLMCDRSRFAKRDIKGNALVNYAVYDDKLRLALREQAEIEAEMWTALEHEEFIMYLQPKYDVHTEKICGAEALVRWQHPTRGLRMPGDFLPLFENNGFVKNLDEYMWKKAAGYIASLQSRGVTLPISVNLSRVHVTDARLVDTLKRIVDENGIARNLLELEVTENYFLQDVRELYDRMVEIKNLGFVLEMDDFGSGYSSLNMLRNAPIDVIKIDRYLLDEIMATSRGRIVVENAIRMSKQLGLKVVAEGVETREQLEFVRESGGDVVQGYYYSKPLPIDEFEKLLAAEGRLKG